MDLGMGSTWLPLGSSLPSSFTLTHFMDVLPSLGFVRHFFCKQFPRTPPSHMPLPQVDSQAGDSFPHGPFPKHQTSGRTDHSHLPSPLPISQERKEDSVRRLDHSG